LVCSQLVREGYELNVSPLVVDGVADVPSARQAGVSPARSAQEMTGAAQSFLQTDSPAVIIEAVKPAQDGSGDVVLRLYESLGTAVRCTLQTALGATSASQCNMLEERQRPIKVKKGRIALQFRPFEIKTLRLTK
jgi:alpha-mannosidase